MLTQASKQDRRPCHSRVLTNLDKPYPHKESTNMQDQEYKKIKVLVK